MIRRFIEEDGLTCDTAMTYAMYRGKQLQYHDKTTDRWIDFTNDQSHETFGPWCYKSSMYEFRLTPLH